MLSIYDGSWKCQSMVDDSSEFNTTEVVEVAFEYKIAIEEKDLLGGLILKNY